MFEIKGVYYEQNGDTLAVCGLSEDWDKEELVLTDEINGLPITKIRAYAFENVSELKKVSIPRSVEFIDAYAFNNCSNLERVVFYRKNDSSPIKIGFQAFQKCAKLKAVQGGAKLELIGNFVFADCISLENMPTAICGTIPIGTFKNCPQMRTMFMHYVDEINDKAIDDCHNVETLVIMNEFSCSANFLEKIKNVKIMCKRSSQFADLIYDGYKVVLTSK